MQGTQVYQGLRVSEGVSERVADELTLEHPLSIRIGGEPFTMTMHTPNDEQDLVRGLLYTEGVLRKKSGPISMDVIERSQTGFISCVNVPTEDVDMHAKQLNKRSLLSVASCGICGKTELSIPEGRLGGSNEMLEIADV
jgi:FdhD protein